MKQEKIKLTAKQEQFCQEYIVDFNGTRAAKAAGYPDRSAQQIATENLSKPLIQTRIKEITAERANSLQISQERVLLEIARLAFNDPRNVFDKEGNLLPIDKWPDEVAATISSIEVDEIIAEGAVIGQTKKIKFWDKGKQLELAGRHLGMWNDKLSLGGQKDNPIKIDQVKIIPLE